MGWLFGHYTRKSLVDHLLHGNGVKTIKHCFKGNNLWAVQEGTKTDGTSVTFIALYLLRGSPKVTNDPYNWGYKDMGETSGPYYYNCPLSYLDMVPDPGGYATEWRDKVREYHDKANQKLVEGQKVRLYGMEYTVGEPRQGGTYFIWMKGTSTKFHLPKRMLKHVEVATQNPVV